MLGYMTARDALANGFTHHGRYFGIPLWIAPESESFPVATKWAPLELVMPLAHWLEGTLAGILYPDREPAFQFLVGAPIAKPNTGVKPRQSA